MESALPVLYKYRESQNSWHLSVITDRELFLSSPSGFTDEWDCNLETRIDLLSSDERTAWVNRSIVDQFPELARAPIWKRWAYAQYHAHYGFIAVPDHVRRVLKESREVLNRRLGVLCLTANPANGHMWEAYAGTFTGFCVGFHPQAFRGYANGPIHYESELPVFRGDEEPMTHFMNLLYVKHEQYLKEEEYRINRFWPAEPTSTHRKLRVSLSQIAEVIIGHRAPEGFADFVCFHLPGIPIRIARPDVNGEVMLV